MIRVSKSVFHVVMSNVRVSTTVVLIPEPSSWKTVSMGEPPEFPVSGSTTSTSTGVARVVVVVVVVVGGRGIGPGGRPSKIPCMASPGLRGLSGPPMGNPPELPPPPNGGPTGLNPGLSGSSNPGRLF